MKIRASSQTKPAGKIPLPKPLDLRPNDRHIRFSFKYLDLDTNEKFKLNQLQDETVENLLKRMKAISAMTLREFRTCDRDKAYRIHNIKWERTTEVNGFSCLNEQLRDEEAWQFMLGMKKGRVHGLLMEETFFVVWLDPRHKLFTDE